MGVVSFWANSEESRYWTEWTSINNELSFVSRDPSLREVYALGWYVQDDKIKNMFLTTELSNESKYLKTLWEDKQRKKRFYKRFFTYI